VVDEPGLSAEVKQAVWDGAIEVLKTNNVDPEKHAVAEEVRGRMALDGNAWRSPDPGSTPGASTSVPYMGTPLYDLAVELAEQYTDDFATQEEFIEGVIRAYVALAQ
jgi:hypothetical protein